MRLTTSAWTVAVLLIGRLALPGAANLSVPDLTIGQNLQAPVSALVPQGAPAGGVELTITSDDPARLLFAVSHDKPGSASIVIKLAQHTVLSPEFWVHGLADRGTVTYTISAPGVGSAKGTVRLAPSGIVIVGPFRLPTFPTTPRGVPSKLTVVSALLDDSKKVVEEQPVAGGLAAEVLISNSKPEAGAVEQPKLTIRGGSSIAETHFKPAAEGAATLTLAQPPGFTAPAELASVTVNVERPGIAIADELTVGKNLQVVGILCLGEAAPAGGLKVTLTSSDPQKMVLAKKEDEIGSGTLTFTVPQGELTATYQLQALGDSGSVTYKAAAEGFRNRVAKTELAPSGFIVAYDHYGPPDEANVLRAGGVKEERRFFPSLTDAKERPVYVAVYSAYLDPRSGFAADITVQPLRAGVSATIGLQSSSPSVATVESPLKLPAGRNRAVARLVPLQTGETIISVQSPPGFSIPKNATSAPATVVP